MAGLAGLSVGAGGVVTELVTLFFGQQCVMKEFPVQLLKNNGYTGCRFCGNVEFVHFAVCNSAGNSNPQFVDVMKLLEEEHGLIQCDLAALKRNGVDISECEQLSSNECAVDCATCRSASSRYVTEFQRNEVKSSFWNITGRQVNGICNKHVCCLQSCGQCGGTGCGSIPGGAASCCTGKILNAGRVCGSAPCILSGNNASPVNSGTPESSVTAVCNSEVCCPQECGTCGGSGCGGRPGGPEKCCTSHIKASGRNCEVSPPPCIGTVSMHSAGSVPDQSGTPSAPSTEPTSGQTGTPATPSTGPTPTQSIPRFDMVC